RYKAHANESRAATTYRRSKILRSARRQRERNRQTKSKDDQAFSYRFRAHPFHGQWGAGEKGIRRTFRTEQAKTTGARPRKCDRTVLRLLSTVAEESAVFKARAWGSFV